MTTGYRDLPAAFAACCQFNLESLLRSPAQLGAFLAVCKIIRDIEPEVQSAAINLALQGTEIPGFTLVRRESAGYVENETLRELFSNCPLTRISALLDTVVELFGHVSADRYRELCSAVGISPTETAIKHAGANPFLRQNTQNA